MRRAPVVRLTADAIYHAALDDRAVCPSMPGSLPV
jgi:hypothetical protein